MSAIGAADAPEETGDWIGDQTANDDGDSEEAESFEAEFRHHAGAGLLTTGNGSNDGENDEAEHIIDHSRTEHGLGGAGAGDIKGAEN